MIGRMHAPVLVAPAAPDGERVIVRAPGVGLWRPLIERGQVVRSGDLIGELSVLGVVHRVVAGDGARGAAVAISGAGRAHTAVDHGAVLYNLDSSVGVADSAAGAAHAVGAESGLVFRSPSSGRFYSRPNPSTAPFVAVGDVIKAGQVVCLLEVMKTFLHVSYGGAGMPERARIIAITVNDQSDVEPGDVLLRLEPAP